MSILIKRMEMPKDKAVAVVIHPDGTAYTAEMFAGVCTEYLSDCTAVHVPPHGDLIDRDALMKMCGMATNCYDCPNGEHGWCKRSQDAANICEAIEDAPTIIPAEEET